MHHAQRTLTDHNSSPWAKKQETDLCIIQEAHTYFSMILYSINTHQWWWYHGGLVFYIKSYWDDERLIRYGFLQWSTVQSRDEFRIQWDSSLETCDPKLGALTIQPPSCFWILIKTVSSWIVQFILTEYLFKSNKKKIFYYIPENSSYQELGFMVYFNSGSTVLGKSYQNIYFSYFSMETYVVGTH